MGLSVLAAEGEGAGVSVRRDGPLCAGCGR